MKPLTKSGVKADASAEKAIKERSIGLYTESVFRMMANEIAVQLIMLAPKTTDPSIAAQYVAEIRRWLMIIRPTKDERERAIGPCDAYGNEVQKQLKLFENTLALTNDGQFPEMVKKSVSGIMAQWNVTRNAITGMSEEF